MKKIVIACLFILVTSGVSAETFPPEGWRDEADPIASPEAVVGGELSLFAGQYPKSFNYYLDNNSFSSELFGTMYETLLGRNSITLKEEPGVANRWTISEDKKTFTFHIDPKARWSDGKSITAHDVRWTYDAIMDPKNLTGVHKVNLETFHPPKVVDTYTIRFTAKQVHWRNLLSAGSMQILPKHIYSGKDFNKINFEFPVVSGPYRIEKINEGVFVKLKRRDDYWKRSAKRLQGIGNFNTLKYNFFAERSNAFEAFKKGRIDIYPIYTSRIWMKEARGEKFDKNWIVKQKIYNHRAKGFQGFAMNMRKFPFDDILVRKAMAYLLDREKMNRTLMYNQYFLHKSYYEDLYTKDNPCPNPLIPFDKAKARQLLRQAGWVANPKTGILEKNGKKFSFKFLTREQSSDKFRAIYAEDLKDVGIEMEIDRKDWAAWARDMDEFNYQMTWAAWGASVFKDPEGMWASKEADRKGGSNITGFKNTKADELIEKQKSIFDIQKRNDIVRQIDQIIYEAQPYVLLWNISYVRLLYWNKFGTPDTVLSKYGDEASAYFYWWLDEDSQADLSDAMRSNAHLPPRDPSVMFDDRFNQ
jgi:microcin C transport system substrate-binding protein